MTVYHIDTDMGVDDALALVVADRLLGPSLIAVSTVFGNVRIDIATRNAVLLRRLLKRQANLDIFKGADRASDGFFQTATKIHGADGLGGATAYLGRKTVEYVARDLSPRPVSAIASRHKRKRSITIVGIGPATNIPLLVERYGRSSIKRIVLMSGAFFDRGNITPYAEFNAHCDPAALQATLDLGLPVLLVPLDVCRKVQLTRATVRSYHTGRRSTLMGLIVRAHMFYMNFYQRTAGFDGCFPYDTLAVLAARTPSRFYRIRGKVHVDQPKAKRGQTTITLDADSNVEIVIGGDLKWVRDGLSTPAFATK